MGLALTGCSSRKCKTTSVLIQERRSPSLGAQREYHGELACPNETSKVPLGGSCVRTNLHEHSNLTRIAVCGPMIVNGHPLREVMECSRRLCHKRTRIVMLPRATRNLLPQHCETLAEVT